MDGLKGGLFKLDTQAVQSAKITVVGVGGGGGNALNNMVRKGIEGISFLAVNTDSQALDANMATTKIQIGRDLTKGLGAGANPVVGAQAAEENVEEIQDFLTGSDMVFITAGMGGGTGTGAAPVVAKVAHQMGILTVAIVTKPFDCEGPARMKAAKTGIGLLREEVDTLIVIPNEKLLDICPDLTMVEAFEEADNVLYNATRGLSDLISIHGIINLDFADVRTVMSQGGATIMGAGVARGEGRAERAAREAISSPLLDGLSIKGAKKILINITASEGLKMRETTEAVKTIRTEVDASDDELIIFGNVVDPDMGEDVRITVIATGIDDPNAKDRAVTPRSRVTAPGDYKGAENLKHLDKPAYARRNKEIVTEEVEPTESDSVDEVDAKPKSEVRVRTLHVSEVHQPERIRKDDHEVPAFIRRMMD